MHVVKLGTLFTTACASTSLQTHFCQLHSKEEENQYLLCILYLFLAIYFMFNITWLSKAFCLYFGMALLSGCCDFKVPLWQGYTTYLMPVVKADHY